MMYALIALVIYVFQSAPAPKDGRYSRPPTLPKSSSRFQSAPAPKDGRYTRQLRMRSRLSRFQSAPAPKDGRYG